MGSARHQRGRRAGRAAFVATVAAGVTFAGTPAMAGSAEDWKIVAHRGGMTNGVQHSLTLLTSMLALKADAVELDVQVTKDRVPLLLHDDDELRRLTTNCTGRVSKQKWSALQKCILRNPFGDPAYDNQCILSLNSAMKFLDRHGPSGFQVFLHVKAVSKDYAKKIANVTERWDLESIAVSSSKTMLRYLKERGMKKQGLVFNDPAGWSEKKYKFLIPYNVTTNRAVLKAAAKRQRILPVESHPHSLAALDTIDVDGVLVNNLTEALIRSGRLAGTASAQRSAAPEVLPEGPSRTTGPMDF